MTYYPTGADLAALRLTFERAADPFPHDNCPAYSVPPRHPRGDNAQRAAPGAWPDELRDGIGYRGAVQSLADLDHDRGAAARFEANGARSRAYARMAADPTRHGWGIFAESVTGLPQWSVEDYAEQNWPALP